MKLPSLPAAKEQAVAWTSKHLYVILAMLALVLILSTGVLVYLLRDAEQQAAANPPLPRKEAKKLQAKADTATAQVKRYKAVAKAAIAKADEKQRDAQRAEQQADSIKDVYETLPAISGGPLSDVQRRLATYQSPDTTR